ncbi:hypothetical protein [uncultured Sphingomonas sp.]|jgi:hypothetical protein|uniref:hypothetical protein n=1 Tax=uncultured Sphingomonas sp. TaxID=158754 RepID=UPI0030D89763
MIDPPFANDWAYCAWGALENLRERRDAMPARVAAGTLAQDEADHSIAVARAIVLQWRWALDPALLPFPAAHDDPAPFGAPDTDMAEQLRRLAHWRRTNADAAPADREAREAALLAEALAWHQDLRDGDLPRIVHFGLIARRSPAQRFVPDPAQDAGIYRALGLSLDRPANGARAAA